MSRQPQWVLTLYVSGASLHSMRAIDTVRSLCEAELGDTVTLEIVDVNEQPALVIRDEVLAAPTLIKRLPAPLRRIVGDLTNLDRLRTGLDLGAAAGRVGR